MPIPRPSLEELTGRGTPHACSHPPPPTVRIVAVAGLPTRYGEFQVVAFHSCQDKKEHVALVRGDVEGASGVPVRLHSECLTGDVFSSLRCDCRQQLEASLTHLGKEERGVILYLRQEGRGIGFTNKIKAYQIQELGFDTIQANEKLGFRGDERDYQVAAQMLSALQVRSIRLLTNNPAKLADLRTHGVVIDERVPLVVPPNPHNRRYLETKRVRWGHLLDIPPEEGAMGASSHGSGRSEP